MMLARLGQRDNWINAALHGSWAVRDAKRTTADADDARRVLSEGQSTLQLMLVMLARLGQRDNWINVAFLIELAR